MTFDSTWSDSELLIRLGGFGAVLCLGRADPGLVRRLRSAGVVTDVCEHDRVEAAGPWAVAALSDYFEAMDADAVAGSILALRKLPVAKFMIDIDLAQVPEPRATRHWWENAFFDAGFRKSSDYYIANDYGSIDDADRKVRLVMAAVPSAALDAWPRERLLAERDLHMDMFRESGSRSDAHVFRYQWASQYVRPGDAVLDAACGLGYGSRLLADVSAARSVTGIDGSPDAIRYAEALYGEPGRIDYATGMLPECLAGVADGSFDVIVSFETLEHVPEPERVLAEFARILSPGGRLVASVPNDWSDATGQDPNPYHFHVYDYASFASQLRRSFDIEELWGQSADRAKKHGDRLTWVPQRRSITELGIDRTTGFEAEWLLAIAAKDPLSACPLPYRETLFGEQSAAVGGHATAWGRDYRNPWLVKSMVSIGWATRNERLRAEWAARAARELPIESADHGAGVCILLYARLAGAEAAAGMDVDVLARQFLAANATTSNGNVQRWKVSIRFALALNLLSRGDYAGALELFGEVTADEALAYHPTLLTKACDAAYLAGAVLLSRGRRSEALDRWQAGYRDISRALAAGLVEVGTSISQPDFVLRELAAVTSQLARLQALHEAYRRDASPNVRYVAARSDALSLMADRANWTARLGQALQFANDRSAQLQKCLDEVYAGKVWLEQQWTANADLVKHLTLEVETLRQEATRRAAEDNAKRREGVLGNAYKKLRALLS